MGSARSVTKQIPFYLKWKFLNHLYLFLLFFVRFLLSGKMKILSFVFLCIFSLILVSEGELHKSKKAAVHIKDGNCNYKLATIKDCDGTNQTLIYALKPKKHDVTEDTCSPNKTLTVACTSLKNNDLKKNSRVEKKEQRKAQKNKR